MAEKSSYNRLKKYRSLKRARLDSSTVEDISEFENQPEENEFMCDDACVEKKSCEEDADLTLSMAEDLEFHKKGMLEMDDLNSSQNSENEIYDEQSEAKENLSSDSEIFEYIEEREVPIKMQSDVKKITLREKLQIWMTKHIQHLPHTVTDELLLLLRSEGHYELPKTTETLLQTKRTEGTISQMRSLKGTFGDYVYLGIKSGLKSRLIKSVFKDADIKVIVNIDGFPVFNNSDIEMQPILMQIIHPDYICKPFIVAIYSGDSKPDSPNDFLNDFVEECSHLIEHGVEIEDTVYRFDLKALVCDTPARAFLKCIKGHTGFWACERCEIKGESVRTDKLNPRSKVRVYPDLDCRLRTKKSFKKQRQPEHHHSREISPLLRIPKFDPVRGVLLDSMHLIPEGAMKLLLGKLLSGRNKSKLSQTCQKLLSELLNQISSSVPADFQRKTFPLNNLSLWKATQYKFVLLYAGPLVFRQVLSKDLYDHFLLLLCACRILYDRDLAVERVDEAEALLREFFSKLPETYGKSSQVMNMHNLIHLADDVRYMKAPLSDYTAFPFENCLGKIKSQVRSANKVVAQVFRRNSEIEAADGVSIIMPYPLIGNAKKTKNDYGDNKITYSSAVVKKYIIGTKNPDNVVQLNNGQFFQVTKIFSLTEVLDLDAFYIEGVFISKFENVFEKPIKSEEIGIFRVRKMPSTTTTHLKIVCMSQIKRKCILMEVGKKTYIETLLHA